MDIVRAVKSGALVWLLVFITFSVASFLPVIKGSETLQNLFVCLLLPAYSFLSARYYYKKEQTTNGLIIGLVMVVTILPLDAFITVPLEIIPKGGSYFTFFTSLIFWGLISIHMISTFLYWKIKVCPSVSS